MRIILRMCLLLGMPISLAGFAAMALLLTAADLPIQLYPFLAALPLVCGCFCAGMAAGRRLRRHGIRCGASAAAVLTGIWYLAVCVLLHRMQALWLFAVTLPCGMCGGVLGVNCAAPPIRRPSHRIPAMQRQAALRIESLHKPKQHPAESAEST